MTSETFLSVMGLDRADVAGKAVLIAGTGAGSELIRAQIQGAQFQNWMKNEDPWKATCLLSQFSMKKFMKSA